ncbi:MAG: prepilin-type N-terminal cleavage/methylation domain [Rhodobacteraceae bacterium HLUCCA12]|nr:MAG: prepilin-type N-terminal cleavage/methylation domain [Rhodobacteraceae bacterium HLUCCA12]
MRRPVTPSDRPDRGMTLIEIVIAIAILSIGLIAALRSYDQAHRSIGGQIDRVLARQVALNRAAELRLLGRDGARALPSDLRLGPHRWQITMDEAQTRAGLIRISIGVAADGVAGAHVVTHVPGRDGP